MVAIRMLVDHLVMGGVLEHNPARFANAPPQKRNKGKTAVPTAEEAGDLARLHREGASTNMLARAAEPFAACAPSIHETVRNSPVVASDKTSARV